MEDSERLKFFALELLLKEMNLKEGYIAFDLRTGTGFFLPFLVQKVGSKSKIKVPRRNPINY